MKWRMLEFGVVVVIALVMYWDSHQQRHGVNGMGVDAPITRAAVPVGKSTNQVSLF